LELKNFAHHCETVRECQCSGSGLALAKQKSSVLSEARWMMGSNVDRMRQVAKRLSAAAMVLVGVATNGCLTGPLSGGNAAQPRLDSKVYKISCEDGRRYAAKALKARSYHITRVDRNGAETTIEGRNDAEGITSRLTVNCGPDGVSVSPSGGNQFVIDGLRFGFYQIADMGDRMWPPPTGPVVNMVLYQGPEAKIEFPIEIEPLGVVAVQVTVINAGERTLRIDPRRVHVVREGGQVVPPLSAADAESRLAASDPDIRSKLLRQATLKHGERVTGFVFFPVGAYSSGSLALIDDQTGEADEYDVSFEAGA
jgi:hypothetical protein